VGSLLYAVERQTGFRKCELSGSFYLKEKKRLKLML
jgi:hypothetical protein